MPQYLFFVLFGYGLLLIVYGYLVTKLFSGFGQIIIETSEKVSGNLRTVSVLVPFRNEEENIGQLLHDLFQQNYPKENFEILLLNDHSDDLSMKVAEEVLRISSFSKCTFIHPATSGKKAAITEGVKHASGEIIITIDADCRVGQNWLASINKKFSQDSAKMVFGPVRIEPAKTIFQSMQAMEFASLIGTGAATMAYGIPTMSNGANLAFRKDVFKEVGGYEGNIKIASGDDEFLMRKIFKKYPKGIRFNNDQKSIVSTLPQNSLHDFILQRIRWAAKWSAHTDFSSKLLAVFIFLFHAAILVIPFLPIFDRAVLWLGVVALLIKGFLEYRFLRIVNFWLKVPWSWTAFILLQVTYSFYAVSIAMATLFVRPVWKGRKIRQ